MDLVRQHLLAHIARTLHDDLGPSLSGLALQLSAPEGTAEEQARIREAMGQAVDTVRLLQYLAHAGLAARFGLRRAFELLPYCAAPGCQQRVSVRIEELPSLYGEAAQRCFEAAAVAVAEATRDHPAQRLQVRLSGAGWTLERQEAA